LAVVALMLVVAGAALGATPKRGGLYVGQTVEQDNVQLRVSADGKSATFTIACQDTGETDSFMPFPIVNGSFSAAIYYPGSTAPEALLRGRFTSATQAAITLNEHPKKHICYGQSSPAMLRLR
jgi:hypothetical protein